MPDLSVLIPGVDPGRLYGHRRVTLSRDGHPTITLPITDPKVDADGLAADWTEVPRGGAEPLLLPRAGRLDTRRLAVVVDDRIAWQDRTGIVAEVFGESNAAEVTILELRAMAKDRGPAPVYVAYSDLEAGPWRIVELTESSTRRFPGTNRVRRADVNITLKRASDLPVFRAAPAAPPAPPAAPPAGTPPSPASRHYIVSRGDSLWSIAQRFLGNGNRWREIADRNGVRDPRALPIGKDLELP